MLLEKVVDTDTISALIGKTKVTKLVRDKSLPMEKVDQIVLTQPADKVFAPDRIQTLVSASGNASITNKKAHIFIEKHFSENLINKMKKIIG